MESTVHLAALAIVSACVTGMIWIVKFMFEKLLVRMDRGNELMDNNNKLLIELQLSTQKNTKATESADQYLRDRNGRDAKIHEKQMETAHTLHKELINAINTTSNTITKTEQNIETQNVQNQRRKRKRLTNKTKKN